MKITVIAHPNAKKARIEKDESGNLHVYVNQLPNEGKANKAVIEALTGYFQTKKSNVILLSGGKSKNKVFKILSGK